MKCCVESDYLLERRVELCYGFDRRDLVRQMVRKVRNQVANAVQKGRRHQLRRLILDAPAHYAVSHGHGLVRRGIAYELQHPAERGGMIGQGLALIRHFPALGVLGVKRTAVDANPIGFALEPCAFIAVDGKHGELQTR
jgi:hypothetical protein